MKGIDKYFCFFEKYFEKCNRRGLAREPDQASPFLSKPVLPTWKLYSAPMWACYTYVAWCKLSESGFRTILGYLGPNLPYMIWFEHRETPARKPTVKSTNPVRKHRRWVGMPLGPPVEAVCQWHTTYRQKTKEKKAKRSYLLRTFVQSRSNVPWCWYDIAWYPYTQLLT